MFQCPNCGSSLRFDIPSQMLTCDHCHSFHDPYSVSKDHDAEEQDMYDVTVFTCPQCGGQLMSTENSAAEFCSFCGAPTILSGRLSKEKRPGYIITFKKTKEDCKNAYAKYVRHAIFAPTELKDPQYLERFRGIYMPYWAYYITQNGELNMEGQKEYRKGDYIYKDIYHLGGRMDSYYKGLSYDASSSFSDSISESIAPFDVKGMKSFTPSFLSGFYADTADVESSVYESKAIHTANQHSYNTVADHPAFHKLQINTPSNEQSLSSAFNTKLMSTDSAMYPVWFLSYRNNDRVSYATVNGQTGKIAADLPVDIKKYLGGSLILALPIFLLLNLLFTIRPDKTLLFSSMLALISAALYVFELYQIKKKDSGEDDLGLMSKLKETDPDKLNKLKNRQNKYKEKKKLHIGFSFGAIGTIIQTIFYLVVIGAAFFSFSAEIISNKTIVNFILLAGTVVVSVKGLFISRTAGIKNNYWGLLCPILAIVISAIINVLHPVSDLFYYAGTILSYIATFLTLYSIIKKYNILASRKLPQFEKRGGEEYENH